MPPGKRKREAVERGGHGDLRGRGQGRRLAARPCRGRCRREGTRAARGEAAEGAGGDAVKVGWRVVLRMRRKGAWIFSARALEGLSGDAGPDRKFQQGVLVDRTDGNERVK